MARFLVNNNLKKAITSRVLEWAAFGILSWCIITWERRYQFSPQNLFFLIHGVIRNFECHDSERKNVIFIFEQAVTLKKGKWHDKILQCPIKQNVTLTHHNGV